MKKITFAEYQKAVREARAFVSNYDKVRFKIAAIAIRVCDPSHGGRKNASVFSITKFADDIELNRKTLYEWIRVKRLVVDKLPDNLLKTNFHKYGYQDLAEISARCEDSTTPAQVKKYFIEQLKIPQEDKKFQKYTERVNAILYNAQRPMNMLNVNTEIIEKLIVKLDTCSALLKKELELRIKFSAESRVLKNNKRIKSALKEVEDITA